MVEHRTASDHPLATTREGLAVEATQCAVPECEKPRGSKARYCPMHRARLERHGDVNGGRPFVTPLERFERYVDKAGQNGCWLWTSAKNEAGYGRIRIPVDGAWGKQVYAHRWSYEHHIGPVPEGMFVMHRCDNPPCVNPAHLTVGTPQENTLDMHRKGRANNVPGTGRTRRRTARA